MLAPIALYPDQLLMQVLMAATFPQQVIDAGQWLADPANAALNGDALVAALQPLPWDPSVKSLVAFPQIVAMMNAHLDWTQALGVAFAGQQVATMARVQFLRQRAVAAGRLLSTPQIRIVREGPEVLIEPADPAMMYVPVYNPAEVYGTWPDQDYPPVYVPPPPQFVGPGFVLGAGIGFGIGVGIVRPLWGWGHPDWRRHEVVINRAEYTRITNTGALTRNNVAIRNNTWHRTAPVAPVAVTAPHPAANRAPQPHGTVAPAAIKPPAPPTPAHPVPAVVHPAPAAPAHPVPAAPAAIHPAAPHPAPPAPGIVHPAPGVVHPAPAVVHPAPAVAPAVVHPAPGVVHPAPAVAHPAPAVARPAPAVARPAPAVVHPAPAVAHPAPAVARPAPAVARPAPAAVARPAPAVARPAPAAVARPAPPAQPRPAPPHPAAAPAAHPAPASHAPAKPGEKEGEGPPR